MQLYTYQKEIAAAIRQGRNIILQAPTGAGKTMAALWPFLVNWRTQDADLPRKLVYAVPMRVLANQFYQEYSRLVENMKDKIVVAPEVGLQTGEYKEDPEFKKDITFTTIDQMLSSWLMHPYSLSSRKGNMNAGAFVGSYLIFDEFHLFDPDSTLPTTLQMLKTLKKISPFILMTATFSQEMLHTLARHLDAEPFLLTEEMLQEIPAQQKERSFYVEALPLTEKGEDAVIRANPTAVAHILHSHQTQTRPKPRTLVVCNQVERAQTIYTALMAEKPADVEVRLLHSRFLKRDRQAIEQFVTQEFAKEQSMQTVPSLIVVATQVVEVGLDMSCATLHTELAPASSLLQRAGRCARYAGEKGSVYVYPLAEDGYAPYHGRYAKEQCDLAWEWLLQNQGRHLSFADEQALINHAHTRTDQLIIQSVFGAEYERLSEIRAAWGGQKDRGQVSKLVRNIQNVSVLVHADPDALKEAPFRADSFSLHPGTLQGKFETWKAQNDNLDPDMDDGYLDWLLYRLIEENADDDAAQGNQPVRYEFKKVVSRHELSAPLLLINPALVGYSKELGLTLYPSVPFESEIPPTAVAREYASYSYRLESYYRHIQLVHEAFVQQTLPNFRLAAERVEKAYGWKAGIITAVAHLVMVAHDIGKLATGWQKWAHDWQQAIGLPIAQPTYAAAHTDYDALDEQHRQQNKKMRGKRPSHAVEGALAAVPLFELLLQDDLERYEPLLQAAFTAVARHHAPFSAELKGYQLVANHVEVIHSTVGLLPEGLRPLFAEIEVIDAVNPKEVSDDVVADLLISPSNEQAICTYMLLVRALRLADQEGTRRGSE